MAHGVLRQFHASTRERMSRLATAINRILNALDARDEEAPDPQQQQQ
jgi:hypothetical protein